MINTIFVTVSDDRSGRKNGKYKETQNKIDSIFSSNLQFGISKHEKWTYEDIITTSFYEKNKILLDNIRPSINGRVYKPFVISESLKNLNDGDFLIYNDCSPELWDYNYDFSKYNLNIIKELCVQNNGILTAHVKWNHRTHTEKGNVGYHTHEHFTTERCMNKMNMQQYKYSLQHASGMIVLQKSSKATQFVEEWLYWNCIDECCSLGFAHIPNDFSFWEAEQYKIGHRHDQSISGLLINQMNNKIIEHLDYYERPDNTSPYNFINFCRPDFNYNFFDSNQPKSNILYTRTDSEFNAHHQWADSSIIKINR